MKTTAKIMIHVEVDDFLPASTVIKAMDIQGDATTLSIALLSAAYGMFDEDNPIKPQLKAKVDFQKAIAMAILNGTLTLQPDMPEEAVAMLSKLLTVVTDTNMMLLNEEVKKQLLTDKPEKDEQGRTEPPDFSNFT